MEPLALTIFWIICIFWAIYYWYWDIPPKRVSNNVPKVVLDNHPDKHSTSSIESLEHSDNEDIRRRNIQRLKYETKTRWPSRTSVRARYSNRSL